MMYRFFVSLLIILSSGICKAQQNYTVELSVTGRSAFISSIFFKDSGIRIFLDRNGRVTPLDDTNEDQHALYKNSPAQHHPSIEYYSPAEGEDLSGKIKRIGCIPITYYDRFSWDELYGRVRSIGNVKITYYDRFGWDELKGKIKTLGDLNLSYYDRFDWDELRGKLKKVGNTVLTYYDRFDADHKIGRIKRVTGDTNDLYILTQASALDRF